MGWLERTQWQRMGAGDSLFVAFSTHPVLGTNEMTFSLLLIRMIFGQRCDSRWS